MHRIGFATVAQSPRDDVIPAMGKYLPEHIAVSEAGCLDGLTQVEIDALSPDEGEVGIVARLKEGGSTLLSHKKILPRMQNCVDCLINEKGVDIVVVLCGADWTDVKASRLVINPGRLFPGVIGALAHGRRLGIIKPSAGQVEQERERYRKMGIDAVVASASPYEGNARLELARAAAEQLRDAECDLIWMTCIGMDFAMRDVVADVTGKPIVLAHALLARITTELLGAGNPVLA